MLTSSCDILARAIEAKIHANQQRFSYVVSVYLWAASQIKSLDCDIFSTEHQVILSEIAMNPNFS